jgi:hypothetical protein
MIAQTRNNGEGVHVKTLIALFALVSSLAFGQGTTSLVSGTVTDPSGAAVPAAQVTITSVQTGQVMQTVTSDRGDYAIPSVPVGTYRINFAKAGFKSEIREGVNVEAGVPITANVKLEVGAATETVVVQGGAELVQTTSAELSSTITGRQINELPTATRNGMEAFLQLPGTQTLTGYRDSYINGLPKESLNVTIDGISTNDQWLKSSDGFFSYIMPSVDSLEEVTLSTSAGGVDSTGQGGAQLKFTTKSGTNAYHGGVVWSHRNTFLNANYYFSNQTGAARDIMKFNQGNVHVGGPIKKDKLLFFVNYEVYRLPQSATFNRTTILPPSGWNGVYTYCPTTSTTAACQSNPSLLKTANLFALANQANAARPAGVTAYRTAADPIIAKTLSDIWGLVQNGNLRPNSATGSDFNRDTLTYGASGSQARYFLTTRLDYNLTLKHHISYVQNYDWYNASPDVLNSVVPVYPGTGTVLGNNVIAGQRSRRFAGTVSLRSSLTARLTNEFRFGMTGGSVLFYDLAGSDALYSAWKGFVPSFGYFGPVTTTTGVSRRNAPVKDMAETMSLVKGTHQLSFGGNWTSVATWQQSIGNETLPGMSFGMATGDPATTGSTAWLTSANIPGISSGDLSNAGAMYAALTGRVSSISSQKVLDEISHQYGNNPAVDRNRQREFGFFAQDTWRIAPSLTATIGLRLEDQLPFVNLNGTYTDVGLAGIWGISGIGNMFKPGTLTGVAPTFNAVNGTNAYSMPPVLLPSVGLAWQLPSANGFLGLLTGHHAGASVLRAGYSISSTRPGGYNFQSIWGSNKGLNYSTSVDPVNYPQYFGAAGSRYLSDSAFPSQPSPSTPSFPITPSFTDSLNDFDPHLKMGYVQSWNIGYQRELSHSTVVEVRFTGNHGVNEWRQVNLNEVNIFENGFLNEAMIAQNNLAIANGMSVGQMMFTPTLKTYNYGNQGLPGQQNLKMLPTALGTTCCNDTTTGGYLQLSRFGSFANAIATNPTRLNNLINSGYPANLFMVNPAVGSGGTFLMTNLGASFYDALQVEVRRRLAKGLQMQGSYVWAHSLTNGAANSSVDYNEPTTFRNLRLDRGPTGFDLRHAIKANWIYELPFGPGRSFLSTGNPIVRKAVEGWEIVGVTRIQAGQPSRLTSGRACINGNECGVVLHNISLEQLQKNLTINKTSVINSNGSVSGILYDLPLDFIHNTEAAFNNGGYTLDPNAPYVGPQTAPGQLGYNLWLRGPWQKHLDVSVVKRTRIHESVNVEFRAQALNVMNITNFYLGSVSASSTAFGQITSAYRDISNGLDPGGRVLEFSARINF